MEYEHLGHNGGKNFEDCTSEKLEDQIDSFLFNFIEENLSKVREKMHCTLSRTQSDISGISDRRKALLPMKPLAEQSMTILEECAESGVIWRNIDSRCRLLTFLTLESDGNWKVLALPVQCPVNTNHPIGRLQYTGRSYSESRIRSQPRSKAIQYPNLLPDNELDRTAKTCKSKKPRRKGKPRRKLPLDDVSAEISPLPSRQSDLHGDFNGEKDISEVISSLPPDNISDKQRFSLSPSSNGSSEWDIALVSSDESLKIDSSVSDRETIEIRDKGLLDSNPGQRMLSDVIGLADQCKETGRHNNQNASSKKKNRVKTPVKSLSTSRSGILGNSQCHNTGKENSHPVWQKVQRKLGSEHASLKVKDKTNEAPRNEDKKQTLPKVSGKLKRKHSHGSRKGSPPNKFKLGSSNKSPADSNNVNVTEAISSCDNPRDRIDEAESLNPEPGHGDYSNPTANSDNEHMEDGDRSLESNIMSSAGCLPHLLANGVAQLEKDDLVPGLCRPKSTSGSSMQKWVPVGTKNPASTSLTSNSDISTGQCHLEACEELETLNIDSESNVHLSISEVGSKFSHHEEEAQTKVTENHRVALDDSMVKKFKGQFESELDRIAKAVDHAHMAQLASEAVEVATGGPIAEFERLLHLSSPVLCLSHSISGCKMCSRNQLPSSLCVHERPNMPLGYIWEWYKKHGSFGLEIRGKDYNNSKRLGIDRFSFRAYFVPYLSAVQLFKSETRENSSISQLPILPSLIPRAHEDELACPTAESANLNEAELIFEYFELEQPQQRRPLYEKIQELVRGDGTFSDKAYGDPTKLYSTNLRDLDPRSWYAVAWYPIYRIPDGNFRAAFLTYHLLGHLVRRNGVEDSVVSPVVGLQTYNAQSECWLQLNPTIRSQASQIPSLDPSKILTDRLRTLEDAASSMSRASVSKGNNLTSVNKHPDYEFFVSRRRYC